MRHFAPHATVVLGSHATLCPPCDSCTRVACDTLPPMRHVGRHASIQPPTADSLRCLRMQPRQGTKWDRRNDATLYPDATVYPAPMRHFTPHATVVLGSHATLCPPVDTQGRKRATVYSPWIRAMRHFPPHATVYSAPMRHFARHATLESTCAPAMRQFPPGPCDTLPLMRQFTRRPCDSLLSMRHLSRRPCDSLLSMRHFTHGAKVRENGPVRAARGPGRVVRWGDQWQRGIRPHDPTSGPHRVDASIGAGHFHLNSLVPEVGPGATRSGSLKHGIFFHCRGSFPARPSQSAAKPGPCRSPKRGSGRSGRSKRAKPSAGTPRKLSHGAAQRRGNCRMVRPSAEETVA